MPSHEDHVEQARRNLALLTLLQEQATHPEWVVAIGFYVLVHFVEAVLADHDLHSTSHGEREARFARLSRVRPDEYGWASEVIQHIQRIRTLANEARYGQRAGADSPGNILDWSAHEGFEDFQERFAIARAAFGSGVPCLG